MGHAGSTAPCTNAPESWANGAELDRAVEINEESISILAEVTRDGGTVTLDNIALYGTEGDLVNEVGPQALRSAAADLLREASDSEVNTLVLKGIRAANSSGKAGHAVNLVATLGEDGSVTWSLGK